jgi:hypothetical protein
MKFYLIEISVSVRQPLFLAFLMLVSMAWTLSNFFLLAKSRFILLHIYNNLFFLFHYLQIEYIVFALEEKEMKKINTSCLIFCVFFFYVRGVYGGVNYVKK